MTYLKMFQVICGDNEKLIDKAMHLAFILKVFMI